MYYGGSSRNKVADKLCLEEILFSPVWGYWSTVRHNVELKKIAEPILHDLEKLHAKNNVPGEAYYEGTNLPEMLSTTEVLKDGWILRTNFMSMSVLDMSQSTR